ncbi:hypothetical protein RJ639_004619 [Escallonia herrerae]|uniref:Uncharacterized protein n=1 Tax=Escallonia herrerae TaxID=1293975 RepID=A0AA88W3R9_9ASTE|nr:hypothetical protein RJ639_004619 [Escallonia herrerae]
MEFIPTTNGCTRGPTCTPDINGQCPNELRAPGEPINIVATRGAVDQQTSRGALRKGVRLLTLTLRIIHLTHLHAPE